MWSRNGRSRTAALLAAAVLALVLGACGRRAGAGSSPATRSEALLRVENQSWLDMNIYVLRGGQRMRLGEVPAASSRVFTLPADMVGGGAVLRFQADPVGSDRAPISEEITVERGQAVTLTIPNYGAP